MAASLVRELLDAGVHFGHRCSRWNPKMKPYIYGKRSEIHIIDIRETLRGMLRARKLIGRVVSKGGDVLFVGTKRQARETIREQADRCNMHYVCERWLGGTLTNFRTIRSRLQRLEELEGLASSPEWDTGYSKKMKSMLSRELKKIRTNLEGIRKMSRLPGVMVVIDVRKETNAIREATALKIPTIGLVDTDSDPNSVNVVIPGNDDAMRAVDVVVGSLASAAEEAMKGRPEPVEREETRGASDFGAPPPRRRGRRPDGPSRAATADRPAPAPAPAPVPAPVPAPAVAPESATAIAPTAPVAAETVEPKPEPEPEAQGPAAAPTESGSDAGPAADSPTQQ